MKLPVRRKFLIFLIIPLIIQSCDLFDKQEEEVKDTYLVSYNMIRELNKLTEIDVIFNYVKLQYPLLTDISKISGESDYGVRVYKVIYKTTFKGEAKEASGLVCVPVGNGPFPILSFQNGTNVEHNKAPSVNPNSELFTFAEAVASTGFIMVIPDYLGFGASEEMFHPYLHAESTKQAVLDMLRAVKEMCVSRYIGNVSTNDLYLAGYSLGGWATMQLHKAFESGFGPEFNLVASACGAGPYDLFQVNDIILNSTTYPTPYFIGFVFDSYIRLGEITIPASDILREPYATRLSTLYDGIKTGEAINAQLTTSVSELFTAEFRSGYASAAKYLPVRNALNANSVVAWKTNKPLFIVHGTSDTSVPFLCSQRIYNGFNTAGVSPGMVTFLPLLLLGHSDGVIPAELASLAWIIEQRRKAGN